MIAPTPTHKTPEGDEGFYFLSAFTFFPLTLQLHNPYVATPLLAKVPHLLPPLIHCVSSTDSLSHPFPANESPSTVYPPQRLKINAGCDMSTLQSDGRRHVMFRPPCSGNGS